LSLSTLEAALAALGDVFLHAIVYFCK
jgi:hypothetical protein